jgi:crotonobetainyl-CoA:carnitine CoA-transferase CaiB-like acyl-CoA transferase
VRMQAVVPRFTRDPGSVRGAGGGLGRDNRRIYGERLGLTAEEIADLAKRKVI